MSSMIKKFRPQESVYNWLPTFAEVPDPPKPLRFSSKFKKGIILESKHNKQAMKTLGPEEVDPPHPDKFIKKHANENKYFEHPPTEPRHTLLCTIRKPRVPTRVEAMTINTETKGKLRTITVPRPPKLVPKQVVSRHGHRLILENSGLVPHYVKKKDFGETPLYLQRRKEAQQKAEDRKKAIMEERERNAIQRLPDEERLLILENMKKQWDGSMREYQLLPFHIQKPAQKNFEKRLGKKMDDLDKSIRFLESYKTVYILDDDVTHCGEHFMDLAIEECEKRE